MLSRGRGRGGFTMVEVIIALLILSTAVLGLAATASRLSTAAAAAEIEALALASVEDRAARIRLDPRYGALDSLYAGSESDVLGDSWPGYTRTTTVNHVQQTTPFPLDYKRIWVEVTGPGLGEATARQIIVAAP